MDVQSAGRSGTSTNPSVSYVVADTRPEANSPTGKKQLQSIDISSKPLLKMRKTAEENT